MIFLTVGTWRSGYDRLVEAMDGLIAEGLIADRVVAQIGHGAYKPKHMQFIEFCSPDEVDDYIRQARLVVAHAGMGSIIQTLQQDKPMVVLPRKAERGEVDNDHQFSTAGQLEKEGKLLVAYETDQLAEKINQARDFLPAKDQSSAAICEAVQRVIDDVAQAKCRSIRSRHGSSGSYDVMAENTACPRLADVLQSNLAARALAVILIVLAHMKVAGPFWERLGPFTIAGGLGFEILVFYSGFLHRARAITGNGGLSTGRWLARRFGRLYPAYWIGLLMTLAVGMGWHSQRLSVRALIDNFLGIAVWTSSPVATAGYARPFWYMSLIGLCYFFFVAVRRVKNVGPVVLLAFVASAGAVAAGGFLFEARHEYYLAAIAFPAFPLGMWAADRLGRGRGSGYLWQESLLCMLSFAVSAVVFRSGPLLLEHPARKTALVVLGSIAIAVATWSLSFLIARVDRWVRCHATVLFRAIAAVGGLSYYIYCVHEPSLLVLDRAGQVVHPLAALMLYVLTVSAVSIGLERLLSGRVRLQRFGSNQAQRVDGHAGSQDVIEG